MFAPKIAKAHTKTAEGPSSKLVPQRSTLLDGVERIQMLQRSIGNQATLRLLTQQAMDVTGTSADRTPDGSEQISRPPIAFERAPSYFSMEGGCDNLHLHGKTDATFDGGVGHVENQVATPVKDCGCEKGVQCFHVTGTLVTNYSVSVTITMPSVPSGLTKCEQGKAQAWLDNVLRPHEEDHRTRFMTYNGQTKNPVDVTGCGQNDISNKVQAITDAEEPPRQAKAKALSEAIDPFARTFDCSDCDKAPPTPAAKQSTKTDAGTPPVAKTPDAGS
jgi:hypothetical protein